MTHEDLYLLPPDEQLPDALLETIKAELEMFAAALAVVGDDGVPRFVGSGTLVETKGRAYVLTAAHVWTNALQRAPTVAIHLGRNEVGITFPTKWLQPLVIGEPPFEGKLWGPDLALLQLPADIRTQLQIRGSKVFFNLDRSRPDVLGAESSPRPGMWVVVGCPALGSPVTAGQPLDIRGFALFGFQTLLHEYEGFDYLDVQINPPIDEGIPDSLKGMSGGGLWWTPLTKQGANGPITWDGTRRLEGVAFREEYLPSRVLRCHWRSSLYSRGMAQVDSRTE